MSQEDEEIAARLEKNGLVGMIKHLITQFDKDPESRCSVIANTLYNNTGTDTSSETKAEPASFALRRLLGAMLSDSDVQKFIPPVVYRLNRCADKDLDILNPFMQLLDSMKGRVEDENYQSFLLFNKFTDVLISDTGIYSSTELYCAYSKEKSKTCNQFQTGKYDANPIIYERDEYWNKSAVILTQASVLLLSSKLDGQTTHKYAAFLLDALQGDNKELITFEHATHGMIQSTPLIPGDPESPICGMELQVSYIKNGEKMDKSCVKKMPAFNMTITTEYVNAVLVTDDAYDGVYNESLYYQDVCEQSGEQSLENHRFVP
ncbi:hypothetical protein DVH05_027973 [Phytophthora capsici]|nr:hypothetical protein DVH05_027973 [Phytophthora capsici]